jgi:ubiquinone biosynthesis protein
LAVFVKFGQLLSVRRDLIPEDPRRRALEAPGQRPAGAVGDVEAALTRAYGKPHLQVFATFERVPIASASVAQVHFASFPTAADGSR